MITDRFWKIFWISFALIGIVGLAASLSLFYTHTQERDLLAALGVTYEEGKDPFQSPLLSGNVTLSSGYLYQNALPLRFQSWSWSARPNWRSVEQKKEGYALKASFDAHGGSVGMQGPKIDTSAWRSITLSVYPDDAVGDLYLDLYDASGTSLGRQSLGWYTESGALAPNTWQQVTLPLQNFAANKKLPVTLTGFSISGKNPGTAFIDEVKLGTQSLEHSVWVKPPDAVGVAYNPFATSTPVALPYNFSPSSESMAKWFTYFGIFAPGKSGEIEAGPSPETRSNGSMTVFRGGQTWVNYHTKALIDWGQVSVFSLLVRFVDDGNFASCAFSRYGETVQLYHVQKGKSEFISQSPPLPVKAYEPWKDVAVGAEVNGNRVSCYIGSERVLSSELNGLPTSGSAGLETWDPNPDAAPHTFKSFEVAPMRGE